MKESYNRWQTKLLPEGLEVKCRRYGPSHNGGAVTRDVIPWPEDGSFPTRQFEELIMRHRPMPEDIAVELKHIVEDHG